jgi:ABC-type lipoprotein release transport system permease subunit
VNNNQDEEVKSKLWKNYAIIMGVMIGGSIVILIGQSAWNGIQSSLNTQSSSSSQATVEANQSSTNNPQSSPISSSSARPTPNTAIVNHYRLIDSRELDKSWNDLSPSFKGSNLTKGFGEYIEWWNSVEKVYIGDVQVIKSSDTSSVVKADLSYKLRSGRIMDDKKKYIYLVWTDGKWLIDGKSETYNN